MNFSELEEEYQRLKGQFEAGTLTEEDFKARLKDLMIQDGEGRWWMIGYETGQWFVHDGENWVRSEPPHDAEPPRDNGEPKKPTLRTSGRQKVLIGGCVLGGFAGFVILLGLLAGGGQVDQPSGGVGAAADGQQATMQVATARMVTRTARAEAASYALTQAAVAEVQASTTDLTSIHKSDLIAAIRSASLTEAQAKWFLDESLLYEVYTGEMLKRVIADIEYLRGEGVFADSILTESQYHDFFISADGMRAEVYLTETWETSYFTIETVECIGRVPPHDVPQTLYLELGSLGWIVYDIVIDNGYESQDVEPC